VDSPFGWAKAPKDKMRVQGTGMFENSLYISPILMGEGENIKIWNRKAKDDNGNETGAWHTLGSVNPKNYEEYDYTGQDLPSNLGIMFQIAREEGLLPDEELEE
jgi:hypothetical protein